MNILLAEDEEKLARFVQSGLQQAGYTVTPCRSGSEALEQAASGTYDLLLLDLMLPGANGFEVLKNLRAFGVKTPVIIVSALSDTKQVVEGLDLGAVDYVRKPFEWDELLARIRAVQRKLFATETNLLRVGDLTLDLARRHVERAGKELALTQKEYLLLEYLARNANRVVSKSRLLEQVWGLDFDPGSNVVEVYLYQLRKKLDKGFDVPMLETMVGAGYKLNGIKGA